MIETITRVLVLIAVLVQPLYWRLWGLLDAWGGKSGWEKFARVGFRPAAPVHG